ncbi:MAG: DUF359 domain-containing protein [Candidatus Micrarchaeia archaeon]
MIIPEEVRAELKKPLGALVTDLSMAKRLAGSHRIISIGDVCTIGLIELGMTPHLAVFDHLSMRRPLDPAGIAILRREFPIQKRYRNPAGTLSKRLLADAKKLIAEGGAVRVIGEEDLTALAFIRNAGNGDIVIYGQPKKGIVIVRPDEGIRKKIDRWLSVASAFRHEVKRAEGKQ